MLVNEICLGRGKEDEGVILLHCLSFPITGPEQKGRWQAGHTCPHVPPFLGLLQDLTTAALTPTLTVAWTRRARPPPSTGRSALEAALPPWPLSVWPLLVPGPPISASEDTSTCAFHNCPRLHDPPGRGQASALCSQGHQLSGLASQSPKWMCLRWER